MIFFNIVLFKYKKKFLFKNYFLKFLFYKNKILVVVVE